MGSDCETQAAQNSTAVSSNDIEATSVTLTVLIVPSTWEGVYSCRTDLLKQDQGIG